MKGNLYGQDGKVLLREVEYEIQRGSQGTIDATHNQAGARILGMTSPDSVQLIGVDEEDLKRIPAGEELRFVRADGHQLRCTLQPGGILKGRGSFVSPADLRRVDKTKS